MCSGCPACCPNDLSSSNVGVCPQCPSLGGCDEFKDGRCLAHLISICRTYEQTAEGHLFLQVKAQRRNQLSERRLLMKACVLFFLLAFTFLMGSVGKEENDALQDYDADVLLPSKVLWLLGCLLFWTLWLLLNLLQVVLWLIKGLLWFISISASPLCCCASFLLSCVLLLLHYTCDAMFFATASPVYVYGMLLGVVVFTIKRTVQRFRT